MRRCCTVYFNYIVAIATNLRYDGGEVTQLNRVSIGKEVTRLARQTRLLRGQCLADAGCIVSAAHFHAFMYIARNEGCTGKQAAQGIGSDKTHIAKAAGKLAAQGLIKILPDEMDARYRRMWLTEAGKEEKMRMKSALVRITDILSQGMSDKQIAGFLAAVKTMQQSVAESLR